MTKRERKAIEEEKRNDELKKLNENSLQCLMCGEFFNRKSGNFYKVSNSPLWEHIDGFAPYCKHCILKRFESLRLEIGDKQAVIYLCHILDIPFYNTFYIADVTDKEFDFGKYLSRFSLSQYDGEHFFTSLMSGEMIGDFVDDDVLWKAKDKKNREKVLQLLQYDPFEEFDDDIRINIFSMMMDYLTDESIVEDTHKLKSLVEIMKIHGQVTILDRIINSGLSNTDAFLTADMNKYIDVKNKLLKSATDIAKENGLANKNTNKATSGSGSLSFQMKKLNEMDFTASEINVFDIKTSKAMQQVADMSFNSIVKRLALNENDYNEIIVNQRQMIESLQKEKDVLAEENRQLKMNNADFELVKVVVD